MNRMERNKRPQIDPKSLRKHSHIVADKQDPLLVIGTREQTDYGYVVPGVTSKAFETLYMAVVPNSTTAIWRHAKKVRVFRVVAGSGYYQEFQDNQAVVTKPLAAGDEFVAEANVAHRLTSGVIKLELYLTQEAKYAANLEEVSPAEVIADVAMSDLLTVTHVDRKFTLGQSSRRDRSSRAAEQIAELRGQPIRRSNSADRTDAFLRNSASTGVNAMPVMDFSQEGAG